MPDGDEVRKALTAAARNAFSSSMAPWVTMIQQLKLDEAAYRGERFKDWPKDVRGNNDLLNLTLPDAIRAIHLEYFLAGADIVETNTFSSTDIVMADYGMQELAYELNLERRPAARARRRSSPSRRTASAASSPAPSGRSTRPPRCRRT